jgi:hypothetical protein
MRAIRGVAVVALLLLAAGIAYCVWQRNQAPVPVAAEATPSAPEVPAAPAAPRYPVEAATPTPLPALKESDPTLLEALASLFGADPLRQFFLPDEIVRHIVVTIDNLPRREFAAQLSPIRGPEGLPRVTGNDDTLALSPANAERYGPYVKLVEKVDAARAVELYTRYYPLFQQAYVELGFPGGYFNDRLIEVIDHLLAAPEDAGGHPIGAPHVLYEYLDPELEARSGGWKLLMRIGPANAAKVKAKLREIRAQLLKPARQP